MTPTHASARAHVCERTTSKLHSVAVLLSLFCLFVCCYYTRGPGVAVVVIVVTARCPRAGPGLAPAGTGAGRTSPRRALGVANSQRHRFQVERQKDGWGGGGRKGAAPWPTSSRAHLSSERPGPRPSGPREPVSGAQKSFPPAGPRSWRRSLLGRMMMMMPICRGQARRDGRQRVFRLAMKEPALYHPRLGPSRLVQTKLAPLTWPGLAPGV